MTREEAIEIYKVQHSKFQKSQDLQWKFNIAMWTLIAAGIYFVGNRTFKVNGWDIPIVLLLIICFALSHRQFAKLNQRALGVGKAIWGTILIKLQSNDCSDIKVDFKKISEDFKLTPRDKKWIFFQVFATVVLLTVLFIVYLQSRSVS